jgi:hypothetical protein
MTGKHTSRPRLSEIELCAWIGHATPGDVLEYHRGFLARDRFLAASQWSAAEHAQLLRMTFRAM